MHKEPNPYLEIPNPYQEYLDNRDEFMKHNPETMELGKLCYEVFEMNKFGQQLLELLKKKFLHSSLVNPIAPNAAESSLYWSGYTDCIKSIMNAVREHKQRIESCQKV